MSDCAEKRIRRRAAACLAGALLLALAGCGDGGKDQNLMPSKEVGERVVNFFSPMEKADPNAENVARTASDLTIHGGEGPGGDGVLYDLYGGGLPGQNL